MIFIDKLGHMITDGPIDELHIFANKLGLRREWFQFEGTWKQHYDLTTENAKRRAVAAGAKLIDPRVLVKKLMGVNK